MKGPRYPILLTGALFFCLASPAVGGPTAPQDLYVSSANSNAVLEYNGTTGAFVRSFASGGGLQHPEGLAFGPNGDLFVTDGHVNSRVVKYTKDGKFIKAWGKKGNGPGEFNLPHAVAIDSRGRVFVADRSNNRIQIFDQDGNFLDQWTQFGGPSSITILPDDALYSVDTYHFKAIVVGSAKDGSVSGKYDDLTIAEGLAVDPKTRTMYSGEVRPDKIGEMQTGSTVRKLVKQ